MSSLAVQIRQEKCTAVTKISRNSRLLFPANISLVKRLVESESERTCVSEARNGHSCLEIISRELVFLDTEFRMSLYFREQTQDFWRPRQN